jgi:hypothetical protein
MIAAETGERIAHILGLPDDERLLARQFAAMMVELGPEETLCRIESSKDFDDRVRTALQLVLQTIVLGRRR